MKDKAERFLTGPQLYGRILHYAKRYWFALILGIVGNALYSGVNASLTYFLKPVLDKGFIGRDFHFLGWLPYIVIGIFIARGVCNFLGTYYMSYVSRSVVMHLREDLFSHLLKIPATYYDNTSSGQILSIMLYNVEQVAQISASALTDLLQSFFLTIGLLFVMFSISWRLSLICFVTVPLISLSIKISSKYTRRVGHRVQQGMGFITTFAEEVVTSYKVVRAFGGEHYEKEKFDRAVQKNRQLELTNVLLKIFSTFSVQMVVAVALAVMLFIATAHHHSSLQAGGFVALMAAMISILRPLKDLTTLNSTVQRGLAGAQSVFAMLDGEVEKDYGTFEIDRVEGDLRVFVNFTYPGTEKQVLFNINFSAKQGETVALVGHSGSGKSTLVSLLPRFYDPQSGVIQLDGRNLQDYSLKNLRRHIAVVSQNVTLFNDTVANNIAYGLMQKASDDEIIESLKAAYAWDFVKDMPSGIHTLIGENGVLLSGGQRQRIAIARAILKNAPVLILDEATSALDTESERYIQAALEELIKNRTTIVIAHRLSTIEKANRILVMHEGRIVESGTHQALLEKGGGYATLYNMQFGFESSTTE